MIESLTNFLADFKMTLENCERTEIMQLFEVTFLFLILSLLCLNGCVFYRVTEDSRTSSLFLKLFLIFFIAPLVITIMYVLERMGVLWK